MLNSTTKNRINSCRDMLVGKLPDPKSQIDQITNALVYKFMDDQDRMSRELGYDASFFIWDYEQYAWSKLFDNRLTNQEKANLYSEWLDKLSVADHLPELFKQIFKNARLPFKDPSTITMFLAEINGFSYHHSEELGNAFEYLLSVMGSQWDTGSFRTPRHIIEFLVDVVDPKRWETIYDPACGTAWFLIEAFNHIKSAWDLSVSDTATLWKNISWVDIDPGMAKIARVNLYLHGFKTPNIDENDTLSNEKLWWMKRDVILANPPFMTPKGGIRPHEKFSSKTSKSEVLFTDYIIEHLKLHGRAGIIVPEGIMFNGSNAYKDLRKKLVDGWYLWAVASLPSGVFNPYAGVKTSILFLDRERAKANDSILFVKISADGYDLGAQRRPIEKNDLPKALEVLNQYKENPNIELENEPLSHLVEKSKIAENGEYNLSGDRYILGPENPASSFDLIKLDELVEIQNGYAFQSEKYSESWYQVIRITNVQKGFIDPKDPKFYPDNEVKNLTDFILSKWDLLMSLTWNVWRVWVLKIEHLPAVLNQRVAKLKIKNPTIINKNYLFHLLNSDKFENDAMALSGGVAQKNLWTTSLKEYQIPLPPLEIQEQIVSELDGYQRIIDGARAVVENYKPTIKIDPEWEMVELGEVCDVSSGGTPPRDTEEYWKDGTIPWVWSSVCKNQFVFASEEYITEVWLKKSAAKLFKPYTTLMALVWATIWKTGLLLFPCTTNQNIAWLYPKDDTILSPKFLFFISQSLYDEFMRLWDWKFKMANLGFVRWLKIPLPPLEIQKTIVERIEEEQRLVDANRRLIEIYEGKIWEKMDEVWGIK